MATKTKIMVEPLTTEELRYIRSILNHRKQQLVEIQETLQIKPSDDESILNSILKKFKKFE